jgi:catechol 2,3-dioxygenase-like lactoylglutathione lyase family enzyme
LKVFHQAVTTVSVSSLETSLPFYREVLGFRVVHQLEPVVVHLAGHGILLALVPRPDGPALESPGVNIGFFVSDLDEARRALEQKGVAFLGEPVDALGARVAFFNDPDGNPLYLCQLTSWLDAARHPRP